MPAKNNINVLLIALISGGLVVLFIVLQIYVADDNRAKLDAENEIVTDQKTADKLFSGLQSTEPGIVKSTYASLEALPEKEKPGVLRDMLSSPIVTPGDKASHLLTLKYIVAYQKALDWNPELEALMDREGQSTDITNKAYWIEYLYIHKNDPTEARIQAVQIMNGGDVDKRKFIIQYIIDHPQTFWPEFRQPFKNYVGIYQRIPIYKETLDMVQNYLDMDSKGQIVK